MAEQERESGIRLTSAERERVRGRHVHGADSLLSEVAIHGKSSMRFQQIREFNPHHSAADNAPPARRGAVLGVKTGVANRFLGRGEGKAVAAVCELEEFAVLDCGLRIESLHLSTDPDRKTTCIKTRYGPDPRAIFQESFPGGCGVVAEWGHKA
jgi:hypothetical protein